MDANSVSGSLFTLLTLIVAPAVLTNASSVLALNTANRFGRIVDRSRQIVVEMEKGTSTPEHDKILVRQVVQLRNRAGMLLRAQTCLYAALGLFVAAALISVVGAAVAPGHSLIYRVVGLFSLAVGSSAATSLCYGCVLLVRETRMALQSLGEETAFFETRVRVAGSKSEFRS